MSASISVGQKVKAYEISEFNIDALQVTTKEAGQLGAREVRVRVRAVSLNFRDLMMVRGVYNPNLKRPAVPCSDGAGEVVEVGSEVTRVKVGDRVMGIFMQGWLAGPPEAEYGATALGGGGPKGMLAESVVLHEDGVVQIPEGLSFDEGATLPCAAVTAWNALFEHDDLKPGEVVVTQGTGGVSIFAIQFAVAAGARVVATSSSDEKLAKLREMGVKDVINYSKTPEWGKEVLKVAPEGAHNIVEVGGSGTLEESLRAVRVGGTVSVIGVLAGVEPKIGPRALLMRSVRLQGIFVGSREMFLHMNAAITANKIKPVIDKVFEFEQTKEAFKYMESGKHFGKIVIRVG